MKKLKYRSFYSRGERTPNEKEVNTLPSETIQGEAKSIAELLQGELQGMSANRKEVFYMDVDDIDQITDFYRNPIDLTDIDRVKAYTKDLTTRLEQFEAEAKAIQEKEKEEEENRVQLEKNAAEYQANLEKE